jgi:class 3 adenylate cyclase
MKKKTKKGNRSGGFLKGVIRQIKHTRKPVTILFTDVEGSTRYWDRHGDIKGRLMIDQHNRVVFPVIRQHQGKIVKTIGDAVMASFRDPENAVKAAIAIQQGLEKKRKEDRTFRMHVRIGVHTGQAIVENKDVFGDAVNVAARIEARGKGDEILVSGATARAMNKDTYHLKKKGSFALKGKKNPLTLYRCKWQDSARYIDTVEFRSLLPYVTQQKLELLLHTVATIGILYLLYIKYVRYLIVDSERLAAWALDPGAVLNVHPVIPVSVVIVLLGTVQLFGSIHTIPHNVLRLVKGGFGFAIGFAIVILGAATLTGQTERELSRILLRSNHLFVEVLSNNTRLRSKASSGGKVLRRVDKGDLMLLADVKKRKGVIWNKVFLGNNRYAWVQRVVPPKIGVPEKRLTVAYKFYFRRLDVFALFGGLIGFVWGFLNFRIRPV